MSDLNSATFKKVCNLIMPLMERDEERRAILTWAFRDTPIYDRVHFDGSAEAFTIRLVQDLANYGRLDSGEPALWVLLKAVRERVGIDQQQRIDALYPEIEALAPPIPDQEGQSHRSYLFLSLAILAVVLVSAIAIFIRVRHLCPRDKTCVLVSRLTPGGEIATRITGDIVKNVMDILGTDESPDFRVAKASAVANQQGALDLAKRERALMVIWGRVAAGDESLTVHFELTDLLGMGESTTVRPYRAEPLTYKSVGGEIMCTDCVNDPEELAQYIDIISHTAAGLAHYARGWPEQARYDFLSALYCAGELLDPELARTLPTSCKPAQSPEDWDPGLLYYYAGKAMALQGDYAGAIEHLQEAASRNPDDPSAWIGIGTTYQSWLGKPQAPPAVDALKQAEEKALELIERFTGTRRSEQASAYANLGLIYERLGDFTAAQNAYQQAVERFGVDDSSAYVSLLGLARAQAQGEQYDAAEATLNRARALVPNSPWAYLELADLHRENRADAETYLEMAARAAESEAYVTITRAELCQFWEDYECAAAAYEQAIDQRQGSGWLHGLVGDFYRPTNPALPHQSTTEATKHYEAATDLRPKDPWANERLAYIYAYLGQYDKASEFYDRAIRNAYDDSAPAAWYYNLGYTQEQLGLTADARGSYQLCADRAKDPPWRDRCLTAMERLAQ